MTLEEFYQYEIGRLPEPEFRPWPDEDDIEGLAKQAAGIEHWLTLAFGKPHVVLDGYRTAPVAQYIFSEPVWNLDIWEYEVRLRWLAPNKNSPRTVAILATVIRAFNNSQHHPKEWKAMDDAIEETCSFEEEYCDYPKLLKAYKAKSEARGLRADTLIWWTGVVYTAILGFIYLRQVTLDVPSGFFMPVEA